MDQKTFFLLAKRQLGLKGYELAETLGVGRRSFDKWMAKPDSRDFRHAPRMALRFTGKLLEIRKHELLDAGDRERAEIIDALVTHADERALSASLQTFDRLQHAAIDFVTLRRLPDKPGYFDDFAAKNAWDDAEAVANARRLHHGQRQAPAHA